MAPASVLTPGRSAGWWAPGADGVTTAVLSATGEIIGLRTDPRVCLRILERGEPLHATLLATALGPLLDDRDARPVRLWRSLAARPRLPLLDADGRQFGLIAVPDLHTVRSRLSLRPPDAVLTAADRK
jgi:hypothetical protein